MAKKIDPDLLTVEEAAPLLRVKEASVRHYVHTGALKPVEGLPPRTVRFSRAEIERYMRERQPRPGKRRRTDETGEAA